MNNARATCWAILALLGMLLGLGACGRSPQEDAAMPPAPKTPRGDTQPPPPLPSVSPADAIRLDGTGRGEFWKHAIAMPAFRLADAYGSPPAVASRASFLRAGTWLILSLDANEGDGIVARQTACGGEMWRDDAFVVDLSSASGVGSSVIRVCVNPLGTVSCYGSDGATPKPLAARTVRAAGRVRPDGWRVELALDVRALLGPEGSHTRLGLCILRQRQARGLVPYEESGVPAPAEEKGSKTYFVLPNQLTQPGQQGLLTPLSGDWVEVAGPQQFVEPAVLAAGVVDHPPATPAEWAAMPEAALKCEDGRPPLDTAFQPTYVRAAFVAPPSAAPPERSDLAPRESRGAGNVAPSSPSAGERLCLSIRCGEADAASIDARGEALWREDSLEVFVGPAGFGYAQFVTNPKGVLESAVGRPGGRGVRPGKPPAGVTVEADSTQAGGWAVRLTIPLRAVAEYVGAPPDRMPPGHPWVVQVVRNRPARQASGQASQTSVLSVTESGTSHCPARFAVLRMADAVPREGPRLAAAGTAGIAVATREGWPPYRRPLNEDRTVPAVQGAGPIIRDVGAPTDLPPPVLDADQARRLGAATMLRRWIDARAASLHAGHEKAFAAINDAAGWRAFSGKVRQDLARAMFPATAGAMPPRGELDARVVYDVPRDGYRCVGVVFQTQPGLPVPVTVYVQAAKALTAAGQKRPTLIMVPAHHTGRNSHDLVVLGASFARAGGVAMAMESIGSGERGVAEPWAHKNCQGYLFGVQAFLAGDNPAGWTVFDISRGIDYLLARGDVDPERIAIVGGVAGGGDITAAAAALDERIAVSIPFNFSAAEPMEPWYDPLRSYWGAAAGGFTPWTVMALAAPRRLVQAQEFEWTDAEQQRLARFQKVYGWLGVPDRVAMLHGGPHTDATHFDRLHRLPLYAILNGWFDMRLPTRGEDEPAALPAANGLDCFQTPLGRMCLAEWRAAGKLAEPHEVAARLAKERLHVASRGYREDATRQAGRRAGAEGQTGAALGDALAARLGGLLGDTTPIPPTAAAGGPRELGDWRGAKVLGLWLPAETDGQLGLAAWLMMPHAAAGAAGRAPAVLGVCRAGKARMLAGRGKDVERMLKAGIAVCLLDARGCGETSAGDSRLPDSNVGEMAFGLWGLGDSLVGRQLRDVRTAMAYLAARDDVDPARMGLWGEGLAEPNGRAGEAILFDEVPFRQTSPVPMRPAEPAGGMLAMMAALWPVGVARPADAGAGRAPTKGENASDVASPAAARGGPATAEARAAGAAPRVRAVLVRGTVASWMSVLQRRHHYVPADAVVPGLLGVADTPLIAEALRAAGVALCVEDLRDGSNRVMAAEQVRQAWARLPRRGTPSGPPTRAWTY